METKRLSVPVTDTTTLTEGEMLALASTFGNVDLQGDRVMPGAFTETVRSIKAGASLPLIWGHDAHGSPQNFVGQIIDADETDEGLQVHARFDLEDPVARKAWKLVRDGSIDKLSIGYSIPNGGRRRGRDGANELHKVNLFEVSLVLTPANDHARVLAVKSADNLDHVRDEWRSTMRTYLAAADADALREKAMRITRECEPIQVATFDA